MKTIALISMLLCGFLGRGQGTGAPPPIIWDELIPRNFYYDDKVTAVVTGIEAWVTHDLARIHGKTSDEFRKIVTTALWESLAMGRINPVRQELFPPNYTGLCDGFIGGTLNIKQQRCTAKLNYILEASRVVNLLVYAGTKNDVNNGVIDQIEEKYTATINILRLELGKMEIEKERRGIIEQLINN